MIKKNTKQLLSSDVFCPLRKIAYYDRVIIQFWPVEIKFFLHYLRHLTVFLWASCLMLYSAKFPYSCLFPHSFSSESQQISISLEICNLHPFFLSIFIYSTTTFQRLTCSSVATPFIWQKDLKKSAVLVLFWKLWLYFN